MVDPYRARCMDYGENGELDCRNQTFFRFVDVFRESKAFDAHLSMCRRAGYGKSFEDLPVEWLANRGTVTWLAEPVAMSPGTVWFGFDFVDDLYLLTAFAIDSGELLFRRKVGKSMWMLGFADRSLLFAEGRTLSCFAAKD